MVESEGEGRVIDEVVGKGLVVDDQNIAESLVDVDESASEPVGHGEEGAGVGALAASEHPRVVVGDVGVSGRATDE